MRSFRHTPAARWMPLGRESAAAIVWSCAGFVALAGALACKPHELYRRPPGLRGVTVPLPPPTYRDGLRIHIDVDGTVPNPTDDPQDYVYLWEDIAEIGRYVRPDDVSGDFVFEEVAVTIGDSCISTYYDLGAERESPRAYYRLELLDDPDLCSGEDCSGPDDVGACVCLVEWTTGC